MPAFSLAALRAELLNDPVGLGYADAAPDQKVVLVNSVPATFVSGWLDSAPTAAIRSRITKADYAALTAADRTYLGFLLSGDTLDLSSALIRTELGSLFPLGSQSRDAIVARFVRPLTRAEDLFGIGTVVTFESVTSALR